LARCRGVVSSASQGCANRKRPSLPPLARDANIPAHQLAETLADREAQAAATVPARRRCVALNEFPEQVLLLLLAHADPGVGDLKCHQGLRRAVVVLCGAGHAFRISRIRKAYAQHNAAVLRKLGSIS